MGQLWHGDEAGENVKQKGVMVNFKNSDKTEINSVRP